MNANESSKDDTALQEELLLARRLEKIGQVLIVLSGKGGVGKSTVATNLSLSLALEGYPTGLLDIDIHGPSVPKLLSLTGKQLIVSDGEIRPAECYMHLKVVSMGFLMEGDDQPIVWRGPIKHNVIKEFLTNVAWGDLDYLVVDCPPGTGDEPLTIAQLLAGKASAVVVTTPQEVAAIDVAKCLTFCNQLGVPIIGIVENMSGFVCPHCGERVDIFSSGGGEKLAARFNVPFLGKIPLDPEIVKSGDAGQPYVYAYPNTKTAEVFGEIVQRIVAFAAGGSSHVSPAGIDPSPTLPDKNNGGTAMKFAIPTYQEKLCAHFGHCEKFALIETDGDGRVLSETYVDAPEHEVGLLPGWLSEKGVNVVLAGGMGSRAKDLFAEKGVRVITGAMGEYPRDIVEQYLKGQLQTGANTCDH